MSSRANGFGGWDEFPSGDDFSAGTYAQYVQRHPQPTPVAESEQELQAQKTVPFWRQVILPVLIALVGLLLAAGLVKAVIYAWSDHSRVVTVCEADESWLEPGTYEFETTDGDFAIIHPDGADVQAGKVYEFKWFGNKPLTSFREVEGATPDRCK